MLGHTSRKNPLHLVAHFIMRGAFYSAHRRCGTHLYHPSTDGLGLHPSPGRLQAHVGLVGVRSIHPGCRSQQLLRLTPQMLRSAGIGIVGVGAESSTGLPSAKGRVLQFDLEMLQSLAHFFGGFKHPALIFQFSWRRMCQRALTRREFP